MTKSPASDGATGDNISQSEPIVETPKYGTQLTAKWSEILVDILEE